MVPTSPKRSRTDSVGRRKQRCVQNRSNNYQFLHNWNFETRPRSLRTESYNTPMSLSLPPCSLNRSVRPSHQHFPHQDICRSYPPELQKKGMQDCKSPATTVMSITTPTAPARSHPQHQWIATRTHHPERSRTVTGSGAATQTISQDLQKKDIKSLTLENLEGVSTYQFLLDLGSQALVQDLMAKVVKATKGSKGAKAKSATKAMPGGSKSSKGEQQSKAAKLKDGVSAAADMFR